MLAKNKDPETQLATRLKNEQERHQAFLYLQTMIERGRLSETGKKGALIEALRKIKHLQSHVAAEYAMPFIHPPELKNRL